ncbi:MAG: hypothetical protein IKH84_01470, partial [Ottowia sp.]|nr:hypothetical protein [Ottowia sp.]
MPSFQPPPPSPAPQRKQGVDVRTLSLAQLHHFAQRGSRSAKAELERRMQAAGDAPARTPAAPAPRAAPTP